MSQYKVYLHLEESQALPDFTYIYKSTRDCSITVRILLQHFCSAFERKHGRQISSDALQLVSESGKCPENDSAVVKAFSCGSDVQVRVTPSACSSDVALQQCADLPSSAGHSLERLAHDVQVNNTATAQIGACQEDREPHIDQAKAPPACCQGLAGQQGGKVYLPIIKQFLERAKEAESKKYFRAACKIYEQVTLCQSARGKQCQQPMQTLHSASAGAEGCSFTQGSLDSFCSAVADSLKTTRCSQNCQTSHR